ncbi:2-nitropropane dioxygenase : 2-nitropropane dioxygenase, NPD OS=bacterium UASB270 GN=U27_00265 PE=4 SV=1: NMO [Gemmata massiliana]|uniref:[Acyl-carrier-protein] S-malonyltransferase-like inserted helical domain-containing protein n=1 Tax=Gemmata massiliana TaxID=1210884 RepID=A0A6P2DHV8_9BACT|nr:PfaD family polyunsaturated fatty acid/polyketide biosynthesis protein [Gemmata massiliana]VTR99529.1 2-nitropropane dioxygenase : 2-nitropropane dioxygenase, NPD OS=bacterium UASB270 GN=U27_00265 PE=4 SV=1: NMO [Gemmata massiliana]
MTHSAGTFGSPPALGHWTPAGAPPSDTPEAFRSAVGDLRSPVVVVLAGNGFAIARGGSAALGAQPGAKDGYPIAAYLPPLPPEQLGDPSFLRDQSLRYPYMTGAMANGIASVEIVEAMSRDGMLGSFGAAGQSLERIGAAIDRLKANLGTAPYCVNLIHSPNEPAHEMATAELLLKKGTLLVEASAYLDLTPAIVRYRAAGFRRDATGAAVPTNRVIAKISRVEVATKFLSPPPEKILRELVSAGHITEQQAVLAAQFPVADDVTVEADSGGHTDNRPAITLLPTILALRDRLQAQFQYAIPPRVGLAGGIATPASVAGAFAMGAAFVVTGSVNQACVESGSSDPVRKMLAEAGQADVTMAPAADMFEMGVKLQVLKRGTMFAMRAQKLFDLYRGYTSWEAIPEAERVQVEKTHLRATFQDVWALTREFWAKREPGQLQRAEADPRHRMALVFRWYLGLSSRWANAGEPGRQVDYQVWCGPAMGAFNEWAKGSHLEHPKNRTVVGVALNLLYGACVVTRRAALRQQGVNLPDGCFPLAPLATDEVAARLRA